MEGDIWYPLLAALQLCTMREKDSRKLTIHNIVYLAVTSYVFSPAYEYLYVNISHYVVFSQVIVLYKDVVDTVCPPRLLASTVIA